MQTELIKQTWVKPQMQNLDISLTTSTDCSGKSIAGEADARCSTLGS